MKKYILLLLLPLAGCAIVSGVKEAYAPKTAEYVVANTKQSYDSFYKSTTIQFPTYNLRHYTNYKEITGRSNWLAPNTSIRPVALYNDKACNLYIDFDMELDQWAFYEAAIDENQNKLNFISREQKVNSNATITERFSIWLPKDFLANNKGRNPIIQVNGKHDSFRFYLPDHYIEAMLQYFADNNINCK